MQKVRCGSLVLLSFIQTIPDAQTPSSALLQLAAAFFSYGASTCSPHHSVHSAVISFLIWTLSWSSAGWPHSDTHRQ